MKKQILSLVLIALILIPLLSSCQKDSSGDSLPTVQETSDNVSSTEEESKKADPPENPEQAIADKVNKALASLKSYKSYESQSTITIKGDIEDDETDYVERKITETLSVENNNTENPKFNREHQINYVKKEYINNFSREVSGAKSEIFVYDGENLYYADGTLKVKIKKEDIDYTKFIYISRVPDGVNNKLAAYTFKGHEGFTKNADGTESIVIPFSISDAKDLFSAIIQEYYAFNEASYPSMSGVTMSLKIDKDGRLIEYYIELSTKNLTLSETKKFTKIDGEDTKISIPADADKYYQYRRPVTETAAQKAEKINNAILAAKNYTSFSFKGEIKRNTDFDKTQNNSNIALKSASLSTSVEAININTDDATIRKTETNNGLTSAPDKSDIYISDKTMYVSYGDTKFKTPLALPGETAAAARSLATDYMPLLITFPEELFATFQFKDNLDNTYTINMDSLYDREASKYFSEGLTALFTGDSMRHIRSGISATFVIDGDGNLVSYEFTLHSDISVKYLDYWEDISLITKITGSYSNINTTDAISVTPLYGIESYPEYSDSLFS